MHGNSLYHPYTPLLNLEYRSRFQLISKYDVPPSFHDIKMINDIIYNEETHYVATFKEYLIYEEMNEFLKRYYTAKEIKNKITKILMFYEQYSKIYANYTIIPESKYMYKNIKRKQKMIDQMQGDDDDDDMSSGQRQKKESDDYSNVFNTRAMESINSATLNMTLDNIKNNNSISTFKNKEASVNWTENTNVEDMKLSESNAGAKNLIKMINDIEAKIVEKNKKSKCTWNLNKWTNKIFYETKQTNSILSSKNNNNNSMKKKNIFSEAWKTKNEDKNNTGAHTARTSLSPKMKIDRIVSSPTNRQYPIKNNNNNNNNNNWLYKDLILEKYKSNTNRHTTYSINYCSNPSSTTKAIINKINNNYLTRQIYHSKAPSASSPGSTKNKTSISKNPSTINKPHWKLFSQRNSAPNISSNVDSISKSKSTSKNKNLYNSIINNVNIINNINTGSTQINIYTGNSVLKSLSIQNDGVFNSSCSRMKNSKNSSLNNSNKFIKPTSTSKSKNKAKVNEVNIKPRPKYDLNIRKILYNNMLDNELWSTTDRLSINNKQTMNFYEKYSKIFLNKTKYATHSKINSVAISKVNTTERWMNSKSIKYSNSRVNGSKNKIKNTQMQENSLQKKGNDSNKIPNKTPTLSNMTIKSSKSNKNTNSNVNINKVIQIKNLNDINHNSHIIFKGSNSSNNSNLGNSGNIMLNSDRNSKSRKLGFK